MSVLINNSRALWSTWLGPVVALSFGLTACAGQSVAVPSPSPSVALAQLEAKPLILPVVPPGGTCPSTPMRVIDDGNGPFRVYGGGPVYGNGGPQTTTKWGDYFDAIYWADPQLTGIVLIRIRDLRNDRAGVFVGPYAAGGVVGTDTIDGQAVRQHAELVLDASHHPATSVTSKWGIWHVRQGLAAGWPGCFGIQVDGAGFTEVAIG